MNPIARLLTLEARTDAILFAGGYVNTPQGILREKGVGAHINRHAGAYVGTLVAPGLGTLVGAAVDGSRRNRNIARAKEEPVAPVEEGRTPQEARKLTNRRLAVGAGAVGLYAGLASPWGQRAVGDLAAAMRARRHLRSPSGGPHFTGRIVDIEARKLAARVAPVRFEEEAPKPLWRRAAGALGAAALVGAAAYGANRFVQGRYGNQGLDSWKAASDEARLRFRSAWGAPKAAVTPSVIGAPKVDASAPGGVGPLPAGVKPAVGGVAFTKRKFAAVVESLVELEARADAILFGSLDLGRRREPEPCPAPVPADLPEVTYPTLYVHDLGYDADLAIGQEILIKGVVQGMTKRSGKDGKKLSFDIECRSIETKDEKKPDTPKVASLEAVMLIPVELVDPRARDAQGQFSGNPGGDAAQDPAAMRAAYRPRPESIGKMIAANHRKRLVRLAKTLGVGATAGVVGTLGTQALLKGLAKPPAVAA
jgi:hypothetical protein